MRLESRRVLVDLVEENRARGLPHFEDVAARLFAQGVRGLPADAGQERGFVPRAETKFDGDAMHNNPPGGCVCFNVCIVNESPLV